MNFGDPFRLLHVIIKGIVIKEGIIINEGGEASPSRRAPSAQDLRTFIDKKAPSAPNLKLF